MVPVKCISDISFNIIILEENCYYTQGLVFLLKEVLSKYGIYNVSLLSENFIPSRIDWVITNQYRRISHPYMRYQPYKSITSSFCTVIYDTDGEHSIANSEWGNSNHICRQAPLDIIRTTLDLTFRQFYITATSKKLQSHIPFYVSPRLTPKERRVFYLIFKGYSMNEMSLILMMSSKAILHYVGCICIKLGLKNKQHLYKWLNTSVQEAPPVYLFASTT